MNNYRDVWGRVHDKTVTNKEPSSNNGWIYTAYAKLLGLKLNKDTLSAAFYLSLESLRPLRIKRGWDSQSKSFSHHPATSRDEILGLVSLGILDYNDLKDNGFYYYNVESEFKPKLNLIEGAKQIYSLRNKHRNEIWKNKSLDQARRLNYTLSPADRYYVKSFTGNEEDITPLESLMFYVSVIFSLIKLLTYPKNTKSPDSGVSSFLIRWMQLTDLYRSGCFGILGVILYKQFNSKKKFMFNTYFEHNHELNVKINGS